MDSDQRKIQHRLSTIDERLAELSEEREFACTTDADYRMVEAESTGLRQERDKLKEILGDL